MRVIKQTELGGPEVLRLVEVERPEPRVNELLVRVRAAGVNPTDWKHRLYGAFLGKPPFVLGWDVSGVVEAVGPGVAIHRPGDEVFGMLDYPYAVGSHADYVVGKPRWFVRKPDGIDHVQAAALPLAALTSWQALVDLGDLRSGQRVLIHAAAGGVGHLAVQIAKARGAYVIGTASAAKRDFVLGVGADEVFDYTAGDFAAELADLDLVLDTVGGDYGPRSLQTLRPGGVLISLVGSNRVEGLPERAAELRVRAESMLVEADQAGMQAIKELVETGRLKAEIAAVLPLAEAAKAHELGETNRTAGKIVLTMT